MNPSSFESYLHGRLAFLQHQLHYSETVWFFIPSTTWLVWLCILVLHWFFTEWDGTASNLTKNGQIPFISDAGIQQVHARQHLAPSLATAPSHIFCYGLFPTVSWCSATWESKFTKVVGLHCIHIMRILCFQRDGTKTHHSRRRLMKRSNHFSTCSYMRLLVLLPFLLRTCVGSTSGCIRFFFCRFYQWPFTMVLLTTLS